MTRTFSHNRAHCSTKSYGLQTTRNLLQSACYLDSHRQHLTASRKVQSNLNLYSQQLLQPLLQMFHAKLLVELRRTVYGDLMADIDCTAPIMLPNPEVSD
jgi:hypothetical protein